jgi:hypothetical protein
VLVVGLECCGRKVFYKSQDTDTSVEPGSCSTGPLDEPGSVTVIWWALWFPMRLRRGF